MNGRYPVQIDSDGNAYIGEWRGGKKNGRGKCEYSSGVIYDGDWKDDMWDGREKVTHPSGQLYDGYFRDGLPEGQGWYRDKDGHV